MYSVVSDTLLIVKGITGGKSVIPISYSASDLSYKTFYGNLDFNGVQGGGSERSAS